MSSSKTLCLNMIVKNEMANLERCLGSLVHSIACWGMGDIGPHNAGCSGIVEIGWTVQLAGLMKWKPVWV